MKRATFIVSTFAAIAVLEEMRPLRRRVEKRSRHVVRNIAMAAMSGLVTAFIQERIVPSRPPQHGLLRRLRLPAVLQVFAGVLLLDYSLWIWHWLNHRWSPLWRFHRVHHVDLDLDSWTGLRFHFGEMSLAAVVRLLQVRIIAPDPVALTVWQTLLLPSIFFHHSKIELPWAVERALSWVIVTPRMHAIHHSVVRDETNSNWSSLLSVWDRIHGTFRLDVPQESLTIGIPAYQRPEDVTLPRIILMPMRPADQDWNASCSVDGHGTSLGQ